MEIKKARKELEKFCNKTQPEEITFKEFKALATIVLDIHNEVKPKVLVNVGGK